MSCVGSRADESFNMIGDQDDGGRDFDVPNEVFRDQREAYMSMAIVAARAVEML